MLLLFILATSGLVIRFAVREIQRGKAYPVDGPILP